MRFLPVPANVGSRIAYFATGHKPTGIHGSDAGILQNTLRTLKEKHNSYEPRRSRKTRKTRRLRKQR